jgi:hypothetical protein
MRRLWISDQKRGFSKYGFIPGNGEVMMAPPVNFTLDKI